MNETERADSLFRRFVLERDQRCVVAEWFDDIECSGVLECSHLMRRGYMALRWDPRNAVASCQSHHAWTTGHPIEWRQAIRENADGDLEWEAFHLRDCDGSIEFWDETYHRCPGCSVPMDPYEVVERFTKTVDTRGRT